MGLPKGRTNNPSGRKVGSKNEKTIQWENFGDSITGKLAEGYDKLMAQLLNRAIDGDDDAVEMYLNNYAKMCEYFKPKQARTTIVGDNEAAPVQIIVKSNL